MYQALYRKYRPTTFDDVISQPHITTTLKNQIVNGKTAHAYIFTGSRGTGKTTCARIFAKALNCENPVNGNPCGECQVCRDADNFALADIIEIDAASNGSVNDARELREAAEYTPERCRYKVYIIDEVHMLSKDAFNALLKLIEEPPPYIKFIMATTEIHKVLSTILSRCQRFDFMRIKNEDISSRLHYVADREGITLENDAADLIAKAADGGMRDALSILDRCIAFSEEVTAQSVSEAVGIAGREYVFALAEAIADKEPAKALDIIAQLYDRSKDMQRLCEELSAQFRNIMIAISTPDRTNVMVCLPSEIEIIKRLAGKLRLETVFDCLDALGKCAERMTRSLNKRIDMEMCIIRMCSEASASVSAQSTAVSDAVIERLNSKIASLEARISEGVPAQKPAKTVNTYSTKEQITDTSGIKSSALVYIQQWPEICERMRTACPAIAPTLAGTDGYAANNVMLINSRETLVKVLLRSDDNKSKILSVVKEITGVDYASVKIGYRIELDRSYNGTGDGTENAPEKSNEEKMSELLQKAEQNGVPVETT